MINLSQEQINKFKKDGFVKIPNFFSPGAIEMLLRRTDYEMGRAADNFKTEFSRLKYDFESEKTEIYNLVQTPSFRYAMSTLTQRNLFLTFELCFELQSEVSKGFPWHGGVQSFGYQRAEEFGCTIWAPLHPIKVKQQRGGMAYVPDRIVSGRFIYDQIEPAIISTLEAKDRCGEKTSLSDYFELRSGILNAPAMCDILEAHAEEDDFEPGDVLVFNKYVVHKSVKLDKGLLQRRAAFVMRFVEENSHYDLQRAQNLEFPTRRYGHKQFTRSHMDIGLPDGGLLKDSKFFDNHIERTITKDF